MKMVGAIEEIVIAILPLIIISAKIPTHTFLDPNILQQDMIYCRS